MFHVKHLVAPFLIGKNMEIKLYTTTDENNKLNKTLNNEVTYNGEIHNDTSIINPIITLQGNGVSNFNYAYIPLFQRYYFIKDITVIRNNLWQISLNVDVLMSFKNEISNMSCIVERQENKANNYVNDGVYTQESRYVTEIKTFQNGFTDNETIVLVNSGGYGGN